jgi:hypothetical protein
VISLKIGGIIVAAFIAGAFVASPELRAYAANTVGSSDIIDESILSQDIKNGEVKSSDLGSNAVTAAKIKDGEVKAAEIATDAVGGAELQGVTKLLFADCKSTSQEGSVLVPSLGTTTVACSINGVDSDDSAFAVKNSGSYCMEIVTIDTATNAVNLTLRNQCSVAATLGEGAEFSIIVYDK